MSNGQPPPPRSPEPNEGRPPAPRPSGSSRQSDKGLENQLIYKRSKWVWVAGFIGLLTALQQMQMNETVYEDQELAFMIDLLWPTLLFFFVADFIAKRRWKSRNNLR